MSALLANTQSRNIRYVPIKCKFAVDRDIAAVYSEGITVVSLEENAIDKIQTV